MKVLVLEQHDKKLVKILKGLEFEVEIMDNDVNDFIKAYKEANVKVINDSFFKDAVSERLNHLCIGLDIYVSAYKLIADNFSQNQINDLTFAEVEYIQTLGKNKDKLTIEITDRRFSEAMSHPMCRYTVDDAVDSVASHLVFDSIEHICGESEIFKDVKYVENTHGQTTIQDVLGDR